MSARDGGPAFPAAWENESDRNASAPDGEVCPPGYMHHMQGMTLRDYFAAAALIGLSQRRLDQPGDMKIVVQAAYEYADLMLAMRTVIPLKERTK